MMTFVCCLPLVPLLTGDGVANAECKQLWPVTRRALLYSLLALCVLPGASPGQQSQHTTSWVYNLADYLYKIL